jgi:hypothetical protein
MKLSHQNEVSFISPPNAMEMPASVESTDLAVKAKEPARDKE